MTDNPMPFRTWAERGEYPSLNTLYDWTRPGEVNTEMMRAGVIVRVHGRWLFCPDSWRKYVAQKAA